MKLKIEYVPIDSINPYAGNAKLHPQEQIEQIKKSIEMMGFDDPIAIWKNGEIIEGHGRYLAAQQLGIDTVPIIRLDDLFVSEYYKMKSDHSYTQEQIANKRKSLEGVLVPITAKWNEDMLYTAGFRKVDCFWRKLNFAGWIAVK